MTKPKSSETDKTSRKSGRRAVRKAKPGTEEEPINTVLDDRAPEERDNSAHSKGQSSDEWFLAQKPPHWG